jgi:hypothetical protein
MIIQLATINLWSSITGTRLGVLLPQKAATPASNSSLGKRKRDLAFQSDLPKYISFKKQSATVILGSFASKTQKENVMSSAQSSSFAI